MRVKVLKSSIEKVCATAVMVSENQEKANTHAWTGEWGYVRFFPALLFQQFPKSFRKKSPHVEVSILIVQRTI